MLVSKAHCLVPKFARSLSPQSGQPQELLPLEDARGLCALMGGGGFKQGQTASCSTGSLTVNSPPGTPFPWWAVGLASVVVGA